MVLVFFFVVTWLVGLSFFYKSDFLTTTSCCFPVSKLILILKTFLSESQQREVCFVYLKQSMRLTGLCFELTALQARLYT